MKKYYYFPLLLCIFISATCILNACSNEKKTNDNSTEEISVVSTKDDPQASSYIVDNHSEEDDKNASDSFETENSAEVKDPQASSYIVDHLSEDDKDPGDSFAIEIKNENAIFEYSLQGFMDRFSDFAKDNDKTAAYKDVFLYVANNKNMDLIGAPFFHVTYVPSMTESGEMTKDSASLAFTWRHRNDDCEMCKKYYGTHFGHESINLKIVFRLNGIDIDGVLTRSGFEKTGKNDLYVSHKRSADRDLTFYIYICSNQYYFIFRVEDNIPNKQQAEEMFYALCRDISGYLNKSDYRYISRGDKHYIEFDDYGYTASGNGSYEAFDMAGLPFNSLSELKEKVTGNGLTDEEKNFIKERKDLFTADENGIAVCDFDNLLEPEVPESLLPLEMVGGTWAGERYTAAYDSGNGVRFLFGYFTKDIFEARLEYDTHGVIDSAKNRDDCSEVTYVDGDGNTTTTEYSFAKDASKQYKHVVKSVADGKYDRTIVIDYVRDIEKNGREAAYEPTRAEIFITDGRNYIFYEFSGKDGFVLPGESELLDYGFKKSDN